MEREFSKEKQTESCLKAARRHIEMAGILIEKGYFEGAIFHAYHALESSCVAGIILKGEKAPRKHYLKIPKFKALYPGLPFSSELDIVVESLSPERDRSLYLGVNSSWSSNIYTQEDVEDALKDAKEIVNKIESYLLKREERSE